MSFTERRLTRSLQRLERKLDHKRGKADVLRQRKEDKRISPATYTSRKAALDNDIRTLVARISTTKGALRQERHR